VSPRENHGSGLPVSFSQLLRTNRNFRRIWIGEVASWLGDWFNTIAIYTLVQKLSGSPFALGLVFLTKLLPFAVASPLAGLLVDRFDRRRLMILADVVRAVLVLGFLLVRNADDLYLIYLLATLQVLLTAVFIPARSASIPNITSRAELLTANALSAATWSTLLAVGAALGALDSGGRSRRPCAEWRQLGGLFRVAAEEDCGQVSGTGVFDRMAAGDARR